MKFIFTVLSGTIIGMAVFYFSQDWKEEQLLFTLSEPAVFGDTSFQNLEIRNEGFDPATNVRLFVNLAPGSVAPRVVSRFDIAGDGQPFVGGFERIRRGERVVVSLSTTAQPISIRNISIKSDRSVASYTTADEWSFDQKSFWIGVGAFFGFFMILGIAIPAYKDYIKTAQLAKERAEAENAGKSSN